MSKEKLTGEEFKRASILRDTDANYSNSSNDTITVSREKLKRLVEIALDSTEWCYYYSDHLDVPKNKEYLHFIQQFKEEIGG